MKQSDFHFTNPIVRSIAFDVNQHFSPDSNEIIIQNSFNVQITQSIPQKEAIVELTIVLNGGEDGNSPFNLKMIIGAKFKWEYDIEKEKLDSFLGKNAPDILMGYARPIVANITNAGPFPTYNLPYYDFYGSDS